MSEPIVGAALFNAVMQAADSRCECTGQCGQPHAKSEGRCPHKHDGYIAKRHGPVRLMAAPADPLMSPVAAAALPPAELMAWCPGCFNQTRNAARRSQRTELAPADALFDL
ncbi:hypothetical protein [Streptomyces mesophilus]|uniref:hypothetical protein n=1 Tax=Streptomyces mesophilus TaxID=1775132 RepID=UPI00331EF16B